jgi:hypothetical protein
LWKCRILEPWYHQWKCQGVCPLQRTCDSNYQSNKAGYMCALFTIKFTTQKKLFKFSRNQKTKRSEVYIQLKEWCTRVLLTRWFHEALFDWRQFKHPSTAKQYRNHIFTQWNSFQKREQMNSNKIKDTEYF